MFIYPLIKYVTRKIRINKIKTILLQIIIGASEFDKSRPPGQLFIGEARVVFPRLHVDLKRVKEYLKGLFV